MLVVTILYIVFAKKAMINVYILNAIHARNGFTQNAFFPIITLHCCLAKISGKMFIYFVVIKFQIFLIQNQFFFHDINLDKSSLQILVQDWTCQLTKIMMRILKKKCLTGNSKPTLDAKILDKKAHY